MTSLGRGQVRKMITEIGEPVSYWLPLGDDRIPMNDLIGSHLRIDNLGEIHCVACGRRTRKSFNQGHCFPCLRSLARCDSCIVKPEKCHYEADTCREPEWGEAHCLIPHTVYLANTGCGKVGITRKGNEAVRWVDQGATQALAIRTVPDRLSSGQLEVRFKDHVNDRTNWRKMLSGVPEPIDLPALRDQIFAALEDEADSSIPGVSVQSSKVTEIAYPVVAYPDKVKSIDLDKMGSIEGCLMGIKGQYLLFDTGVINIRKYGGYLLALEGT